MILRGGRATRIILTLLVLVLGFAGGSSYAEPAYDTAALKVARADYEAAEKKGDAVAAAIAAGKVMELLEGISRARASDGPYWRDEDVLTEFYIKYSAALLVTGDIEAALGPLRKVARRVSPYRSGEQLKRSYTKSFEALNGGSDVEILASFDQLAVAFFRINSRHNAASALSANYERVIKTYGKNSEAFADINLALGVAYAQMGDPERKAEGLLKTASKTYRKKFGDDYRRVGLAEFWLGKARLDRGKYEAAEKNFTTALPIIEKQTLPDRQLELSLHANLVHLFQELGDKESATKHCRLISIRRPKVEVDGFRPLYKKAPVYPRSYRAIEREGWVIVEFTVNSNGEVLDPYVVESGGGGKFEVSALAAVAHFRYAPAIVNGEFVDTEGVRNRIIFKMAK